MSGECTCRGCVTEDCGEQYERHPTRPELVAVCSLPKGHDGPHSNVLSKHGRTAS